VTTRFRDRREAGRILAQALSGYAGRKDVTVLALLRGGVPVACEVARELSAALDIAMVHRLTVPHHPGRGMGAVASGGDRVIDDALVRELAVPARAIEDAVDHAVTELTRREHTYRGGMFGPHLRGRTVILVDDGLATGATMRAAIRAVRRQEPARIIAAVPVEPATIRELLAGEADEVVCLRHPERFVSIDACYEHFPQVTDDEARRQVGQFNQSIDRETVRDRTLCG
jgi:putative phosphoribosyl transferase